MQIPITSPLGYIGVFLLIVGVFLVLTGFNILKVQQVTVTPGRKTWGFGLTLVILGFISILGEAAGLGKDTVQSATETPASIPTKLATQFASAEALLEEAKTWPLIFSDSFDVENNQWTVGTFRGNEVGSWSITESKYRWQMEALENSAIQTIFPTINAEDDFYLSVDTFVKSASSIEIRYGLLFRSNEEAAYTFRIENGPYYRIRLWFCSKGEWMDLTERLLSPHIQTNEGNRLGVIADGPHLFFFINDKFVHDLFDSKLASGNVGLSVTVDNTGDSAIIDFDNFELRRKPE